MKHRAVALLNKIMASGGIMDVGDIHETYRLSKELADNIIMEGTRYVVREEEGT